MTEHAYYGACHCAAIGYTYRTALPPGQWSVRECQCAFCRAHAATTTSDPGGSIEFTVRDAQGLHRYRFGLRTADFLLCRNCGVYIGALARTGRGQFGIINLHALRASVLGLPAPMGRNYEGEDAAARVARRMLQWTPVIAAPA
jgi:hypothetical protein